MLKLLGDVRAKVLQESMNEKNIVFNFYFANSNELRRQVFFGLVWFVVYMNLMCLEMAGRKSLKMLSFSHSLTLSYNKLYAFKKATAAAQASKEVV
jgi:hypothetical protein